MSSIKETTDIGVQRLEKPQLDKLYNLILSIDKEHKNGVFDQIENITLMNPNNKIMEAVSVYYSSVINYTIENIIYELNRQTNVLPKFRSPVPIIVSGGLALAKGFVSKVEKSLSQLDFPIEISEVRRASNPMTAVANGCLLAAQL